MISFKVAIMNGFKKAFDFSSRATRTEYWWWQLFQVLATIICLFLGGFISTNAYYFTNSENVLWEIMPYLIWNTICIIPNISLLFRRLHDGDSSAWNLLWLVLPFIGNIIIFILTLIKSAPDNEYGPKLND